MLARWAGPAVGFRLVAAAAVGDDQQVLLHPGDLLAGQEDWAGAEAAYYQTVAI